MFLLRFVVLVNLFSFVRGDHKLTRKCQKLKQKVRMCFVKRAYIPKKCPFLPIPKERLVSRPIKTRQCRRFESSLKKFCNCLDFNANFDSEPARSLGDPYNESDRLPSDSRSNSGFDSGFDSRSDSVEDNALGLNEYWIADLDCQVGNGSSYRGTVSSTVSGITCQKWIDQSPHDHMRTEYYYPTAGLGDHNRCRNPDNEGGQWCYTTDPAVRWELCDIPECATEYTYACQDGAGYNYRGTATQLRGPPPEPQECAGKCRNTPGDGMKGVWCYAAGRRHLCDVPSCGKAQPRPFTTACYNKDDLGRSYRGQVSTTFDGVKCQRWDRQKPHRHGFTDTDGFGLGPHNYCRNPDGESAPWCYTTDAEKRWDFCPIAKCSDVIAHFDIEAFNKEY